MKKNYLPNFTNVEVAEAAAQGRVLILPLGTVESNGPHQVIGCDFILAERIASAVAACTEAIRLPTLHYGVSELHSGLPGTFALPEALFRSLLETILRESARNRFERILVLNCHRHNHQSIEILARELRRECGLVIACIDPLDAIRSVAGELFAGDPKAAVGHGGEPLMSLIAHLEPTNIRMDLAPSAELAPFLGFSTQSSTRIRYKNATVGLFPFAEEINPSGAWADLSCVSAERGEKAFESVVQFIAEFVRDFSPTNPK